MKRMLSMVVTMLLIVAFVVPTMAEETSDLAGQTVMFGHFDQSYPNEPIAWQVLTVFGDTAVFLSKNVLECQRYDKETSEWNKSDLCKWLNGTFLANAFTQEEREWIIRDLDGNAVSIPSVADVTNESFGFFPKRDAEDQTRCAGGTSYAVNHGLWTSQNGMCGYYTRTPVNDKNVYMVRAGGAIGIAAVNRDNVGVRVMISVNLIR